MPVEERGESGLSLPCVGDAEQLARDGFAWSLDLPLGQPNVSPSCNAELS